MTHHLFSLWDASKLGFRSQKKSVRASDHHYPTNRCDQTRELLRAKPENRRAPESFSRLQNASGESGLVRTVRKVLRFQTEAAPVDVCLTAFAL